MNEYEEEKAKAQAEKAARLAKGTTNIEDTAEFSIEEIFPANDPTYDENIRSFPETSTLHNTKSHGFTSKIRYSTVLLIIVFIALALVYSWQRENYPNDTVTAIVGSNGTLTAVNNGYYRPIVPRPQKVAPAPSPSVPQPSADLSINAPTSENNTWTPAPSLVPQAPDANNDSSTNNPSANNGSANNGPPNNGSINNGSPYYGSQPDGNQGSTVNHAAHVTGTPSLAPPAPMPVVPAARLPTP